MKLELCEPQLSLRKRGPHIVCLLWRDIYMKKASDKGGLRKIRKPATIHWLNLAASLWGYFQDPSLWQTDEDSRAGTGWNHIGYAKCTRKVMQKQLRFWGLAVQFQVWLHLKFYIPTVFTSIYSKPRKTEQKAKNSISCGLLFMAKGWHFRHDFRQCPLGSPIVNGLVQGKIETGNHRFSH